MGQIDGGDRSHVSLLPARVEDYMGSNAAVRVIDAFVDGLDLGSLGFGRAVPASTGRPGHDLRDVLKLYG